MSHKPSTPTATACVRKSLASQLEVAKAQLAIKDDELERAKVDEAMFFIVLTLAFLAGIRAAAMRNIIGFIFPAIKSIRAMETHTTTEVTQWLVYWVVYASFSVIEINHTIEIDALTYWIPFYYRFKLGFLLWAMLPQTRGAKYLYDHILRDFLKLSSSKVVNAVKNTNANKERGQGQQKRQFPLEQHPYLRLRQRGPCRGEYERWLHSPQTPPNRGVTVVPNANSPVLIKIPARLR